MDLKVIADALAARFVDVSATLDSTTETVTATADLPNALDKLGLLVLPPTGTLLLDVGATNRDVYDFPVLLLRDPVDVPTRIRWLYAWATVLRPRVELDMDLGLPTLVQDASPVSMRLELKAERYGDLDYDVVELVVRVQLHEVDVPIGA